MGAGHGDALARQLGDGRRNDARFLAADQSVLAGVRIEPGDGDARAVDAEVVLERGCGDANGLADQRSGQRARHVGKGNVHRGRHDLELVRHQHHHRAERAAAAVSGGQQAQECRVAGIVERDRAQGGLGDRVCDERQRLAAGNRGGRVLDCGDDLVVRSPLHCSCPWPIGSTGSASSKRRCGFARAGDRHYRARRGPVRAARSRITSGSPYDTNGCSAWVWRAASRQSDVRADSGRIAHRHGEWRR